MLKLELSLIKESLNHKIILKRNFIIDNFLDLEIMKKIQIILHLNYQLHLKIQSANLLKELKCKYKNKKILQLFFIFQHQDHH